MNRRRPINLAWAALLLLAGQTFGQVSPHPTSTNWPFARLRRVGLEIPDAAVQSLRTNNRAYIRATWTDEANRLFDVGVRVKGQTGSLRLIDDKPSLTVDFGRFLPGQRFQGLSKVHLNNAVEDPSYLHEMLGTALFRTAGVPVPRVGHAVVTLNGRRLGLYVVKEGFEAEFLTRHFPGPRGNLYEPEPGPGCDVDGPMRLSSGPGPTNRIELAALAAAAETDPARRWEHLGAVLARQEFISFLALETLTGHRDGYGLARNNYRLYHDATTGHFHFLPSGMDRLFLRPNAPLQPRFSGAVAQAVVATPGGLRAYREQLGWLTTNVLSTGGWTNRVHAWATELGPGLTRQEAASLNVEAADLSRRFQARLDFVKQVLARPWPQPLQFEDDSIRLPLSDWQPTDPPERGRLEKFPADSSDSLVIVAGPRTSASWRLKVLLNPGRYRFEARTRVRGVTPLPFGKNHGATLNIDGQSKPDTQSLLGDTDWTWLRMEVEIVGEPTEVELSCTLRASGGQAWFDSPRLLRTSPSILPADHHRGNLAR